MMLLHGTTRARAVAILRDGPDPGYSLVYPLLLSPLYAVFDSLPAAYEAVKALSRKYEEVLSFKYTGPWPPYNFVNIKLKLERADA